MTDDRTRSLRPDKEKTQPTPTPTPRELTRGERIGQWTIDRRLGGGGFGTVYAAWQAETGATAAIKMLHAHFVASPEMLARFDREVQVLSRLRHPGIVQIVDAGFDDDGRPYLVTELLLGRDLATILKAERGLHVDVARNIIEPLCEAIAFAHDHSIVHRDLKASNVFVCDDTSRVVLLDFGIAKLSDALAPELTASHQSLGTPGCMAPEQIHGGRVDARTDVYSLGALLFHMLTGQQPFYDQSDTMTQYLHLHARRPRASALVQAASRFDDVIVKAMAIEPNERFQDARSLLAALRRAARESQNSAPVSTTEHAAIFVSVEDTTAASDLDDALLADLENVLPIIERALAERGFTLAVDLGSSALFVAPFRDPNDAIASAVAAWDRVDQRAGRDDRVRVGMSLHRGLAKLAGNRVEPCALLRPETWGMPDPLEGLWLTSAIESPPRRLR